MQPNPAAQLRHRQSHRSHHYRHHYRHQHPARRQRQARRSTGGSRQNTQQHHSHHKLGNLHQRHGGHTHRRRHPLTVKETQVHSRPTHTGRSHQRHHRRSKMHLSSPNQTQLVGGESHQRHTGAHIGGQREHQCRQEPPEISLLNRRRNLGEVHLAQHRPQRHHTHNRHENSAGRETVNLGGFSLGRRHQRHQCITQLLQNLAASAHSGTGRARQHHLLQHRRDRSYLIAIQHPRG